MRPFPLRAWAALALLLLSAPAFATSPVSIVMGTSRDGAMQNLQKKVDRLLGPNQLDVLRDFVGANAGEPDPWFWVNNGDHVISVTLLERKAPHGLIGWYEETFSQPVLDGVNDGVVLNNLLSRGSRVAVHVPGSVTSFGFYLVHQGGDEMEDEGRTWHYFTNRFLNDIGPHDRGATHEPFGGDAQMLVYDVSRWMGTDTWLVACEYSDSGFPVGVGLGESDNDFSDVLFTVTGLGATPTLTTTFSRLKAMFH